MLTLASLAFLRINCSYALFEAEERLVDFGALNLPIFRVILTVRGPLTASQVDKEQLSALFDSFFLDFDLADSVTAT